MGNWNRRYYYPRKKYKPFDYYQDPSLSQNHSSSSGVDNGGVISWEMSYCNSVRVPWYKVVASKKYVFCHPTVFNWDDSGAKEAFEIAKQRFWAKFSGFTCESSLPDPNMYIDEIDWNPHMDPELMDDLDRQFFNPDNEHEVDKLDTEAKNSKNEGTVENPWEKSPVQGGRLTDIAQGWGQWDTLLNLKNDNPWMHRGNQVADSSKEFGWRSGNESWGWNQGHANGIRFSAGDPWNYGRQTTHVKPEGRGQREMNFQGRSRGIPDGEKSWNCGNYGDSWGNNYSTGSKGRGWMNYENPSWGWRESEFPANDSRCWDSREFRRGGGTYRGGGRKRESSIQNPSKYKSSRYQYDRGDDRGV